MSRGELQVALGFEEAERKIAAGKFEEVEDSDGEILYKKTTKRFTESAEKKITVRGERHIPGKTRKSIYKPLL